MSGNMTSGFGFGTGGNNQTSERMSIYNSLLEDSKYYRIVPMTNNKFLAEGSVDTGIAPGDTLSLTGSFMVRTGYCIMTADATLKDVVGWGTADDRRNCKLTIFKFTPTDGSSENVEGVVLATCDIEGGGNNETKSLTPSFSEQSLSKGDIIIPCLSHEQAEVTIGAYFNFSLIFEM